MGFVVLVFFAVQLITDTAVAQPTLGYVEAPEDEALAQRVTQYTKEAVKRYDGFYRSKLKELHEKRDARLLNNYADGHYLADEYWQDWIDALLARVIDSNPELQSEDLRVFVGRGSSVNARCYGNGVLVLDLGLLVRLQSDDQVAFVLCHEIAHQVLDHVENRYAEYIDRLYSKETQRTLRKVLRSNNEDSYDEYVELSKTLAFDFSRHSRYGETEADALGLTFYQNAGFAADGPLGVMEVLAKADSSQFEKPLDLAKMLSTADYPAKARWFMVYEDDFLTKTDTLTTLTRDSLRTHPAIEARKLALSERKVQQWLGASEVSSSYQARRGLAAYALTAGAFDASRLDLSLYYALRGLEARPDDAWYRGCAALSLAFLAEARLGTRFSDVCPLPTNHHDEQRRALMHVLHNMRSKDLKELAYHYAASIPETQQTAESMLALVVALELDEARSREAKAARIRFRNTYPKHSYKTWLVND